MLNNPMMIVVNSIRFITTFSENAHRVGPRLQTPIAKSRFSGPSSSEELTANRATDRGSTERRLPPPKRQKHDGGYSPIDRPATLSTLNVVSPSWANGHSGE